jgi:hypothetical protein
VARFGTISPKTIPAKASSSYGLTDRRYFTVL